MNWIAPVEFEGGGTTPVPVAVPVPGGAMKPLLWWSSKLCEDVTLVARVWVPVWVPLVTCVWGGAWAPVWVSVVGGWAGGVGSLLPLP